MHGLVESRGAWAVWSIGLHTLGYPPTMAHTVEEALLVGDEVRRVAGLLPDTDTTTSRNVRN